MRFLCFVAYLIGFRRILLLVLVLMAIAIAQHHKRCVAAVSPPTCPTADAPSKPSARKGKTERPQSRLPATVFAVRIQNVSEEKLNGGPQVVQPRGY